MISRLVKYFDSRTMGFKLTVVFLSVILIPMGILAYVSYKVVDGLLVEEAYEKLDMGLKSAWREYFVRGEQMRYGMLQAAAMEEIKAAVAARDTEYLRRSMSRWKLMRPYVDIWNVVDADGRAIVRLNSEHSGDVVDINGLVANAITVGEPLISSEVISGEMLAREWSGLKEMVFPNSTVGADGGGGELKALALVVVTPVSAGGGKVSGAIVTADILNNDPYIADTLSTKIPGLFTTVSLDGTRIATNLGESSGRTLRLSELPADVMAEVRSDRSAFREWGGSDARFMTIFEPIHDNRGSVIGTLDVSVSKDRLWGIQRQTVTVIAVMTLIGVTFSLFAAFVSTRRITRPLTTLKAKLGAFAEGDMMARVDLDGEPGSKDEIQTLAGTFNAMMDVVSRREDEKRRHLREIEEKNRALHELNDELKGANEELEVAYEETQSQTEELHAINEELKLLNEDLDRKNAELKRANRLISEEEAELKSARNKLRLIYDSIRDHIALVDPDRAIVEANRHLKESLGLGEESLSGRELFGLMGLEEPAGGCPVRRSIEENEPAEAELTTADGKVLMLQSYPLEGEEGMAVVYMKDVTDQRLLTQQLIQSDKLSSLGELVSGVAHELNNPLTGIMCFSELLMDECLPEDAVVKLGKINDASHRCKKIIDNLLTFARWHRPERTYDDINRVVRESVDLREYQLKVDNVEIETDLDESVPLTMFDPHQMQQVFINLINNARDALIESGGGKLRISTTHDEGRIIIRFEDTGAGMSEEVVGRIFDPFFTTKDVGKGTGLGLSISYGIVNEHGGSVYATSKAGHGTTFAVELPVMEKEEEGEGRKITGTSDGLMRLKACAKGMKAFVLDDEQIVLELVRDTLRSCGFTVDACRSGHEALGILDGADYDIIISDIKMPGLDGRAFYERIKEVNPDAAAKMVFISGDSVNPDTRSFLEGIECLSIRKPFTVEELAGTVLRVVSRDGAGK